MKRIHTCRIGWESVLQSELARVFPHSRHEITGAGWLSSELGADDAAATPAIAFADQCLPSPDPVTIPSIRKGAELVGNRLVEGLRAHDGPWRFHVFSVWPLAEETVRPKRFGRRVIGKLADEPATKEGLAGPRRCALLGESIEEFLKKKQRRLLRTQTMDPMARLVPEEWLVQVGLVTATEGYLSFCPPAERQNLRRVLSPFPGGIVQVPEDPAAPSQAYRKLAEALWHSDWKIESGQTCIDLGASPGGWTHVALERGAKVSAVDRSPLAAALMRHPRLRFHKGDAFEFVPDNTVDWLLCDVIAFPARSKQLFEQWVTKRWCKQFVVTIKFRGSDEYPILEEVKRFLEQSNVDFFIRRLTANKNEITVVGRLSQSL